MPDKLYAKFQPDREPLIGEIVGYASKQFPNGVIYPVAIVLVGTTLHDVATDDIFSAGSWEDVTFVEGGE